MKLWDLIKNKIDNKVQEKKDKKKVEAERKENFNRVMKEEEERRKLPESDEIPSSYVSLRHINKIYDNNVQAVFDFNLDIQKGEFIVFVGPSGCGKSTTLRMIAGLEEITTGDLFIDGVYSNDLEPKNRNTAMVFQNYALYPHLSVYDNMAIGLKVKHLPKEEIDRKIKEASRILQLEDYLKAKPRNLSGGQCQRVALGRAIVKDAKVFLMDEPLSNLDAKLRVQMRSEIISLHKNLNATTIYVTHDQVEAMTMADRIVVMNKGVIQQIGTPEEIYSKPVNTFVATFIGSPSMNLISAHAKENKIKVFDSFIELNYDMCDIEGKDVIIGIRPEDISIQKIENGCKLDSILKFVEMSGKEYILHVISHEQEITVVTNDLCGYVVGDEVSLYIDKKKIHLFDESGRRME